MDHINNAVANCFWLLEHLNSFWTALYFDLDNIATLEGEVLSVSWRNPHVMFEIRRTDDGGTNEIWEIEASSMNALLRVGVEAGDQELAN